MGPGLFQRHYALCDGVLVYIQVSWSLVLTQIQNINI